MNVLSDIIEIEETIAKMLEEIKINLLKDISNVEINNTISISKNISVVKLSNLIDNIWTPEYYIGNAQLKYIAKKLENVKTTKQMIDVLNDIIKTKNIIIGKNKYQINPSVINILIKYIGKNT